MTIEMTKKKAVKSGKKQVYPWDKMKVGDEGFMATGPISHVGNNWAERHNLDWEFGSEKIGRRQYRIFRKK